MVPRTEPALSVVVLAERRESLDALAERLAQQRATAIELVVVGASGLVGAAGAESIWPRLVGVEVARDTAPAAARSAGVRAATAPYVFLGEAHALPCPGWATALVAEHERGAACVVPTFVNANAPHPVGQAAFLLAYAAYVDATAMVPRTVPAYNCSWRRSILTGLGPELERLVTPGSPLPVRCARAHGGAVRPSQARLEHVNATSLRVLLTERFLLGRVIGAERARGANPLHRLASVVASPLVAPLLFGRVVRDAPAGALRPATLLPMLLAATAQALGEAVGGVVGRSDADHRLSSSEKAREGATA